LHPRRLPDIYCTVFAWFGRACHMSAAGCKPASAHRGGGPLAVPLCFSFLTIQSSCICLQSRCVTGFVRPGVFLSSCMQQQTIWMCLVFCMLPGPEPATHIIQGVQQALQAHSGYVYQMNDDTLCTCNNHPNHRGVARSALDLLQIHNLESVSQLLEAVPLEGCDMQCACAS